MYVHFQLLYAKYDKSSLFGTSTMVNLIDNHNNK